MRRRRRLRFDTEFGSPPQAWGCGSDAGDSEREETRDGGVFYRFATPWSPPLVFLRDALHRAPMDGERSGGGLNGRQKALLQVGYEQGSFGLLALGRARHGQSMSLRVIQGKDACCFSRLFPMRVNSCSSLVSLCPATLRINLTVHSETRISPAGKARLLLPRHRGGG